MQPIAALTTDVLALGTVLLQILALLLLIALIFKKQSSTLLARITPYIVPFAFLVTLAGAVLTLVYSEVFGFAPCALCWAQRAFLYPMPILLCIAMAKPLFPAWKYVLGLSIPGAIVAFYQHYLQVGGTSIVPCPSIPGAADCAQRIIFEFGFVTFPFMAFIIFVFVGLLMIVLGRSRTT